MFPLMRKNQFFETVAFCALLIVPLKAMGEAAEQAAAPPVNGRTVFERLTDVQKQGFLDAIHEQDRLYDPEEHMIRRPFSSPGYHTTLRDGVVHPTRESLSYAVALLDSGDRDCLLRAQEILRRVIPLQDQHPSSRTYGIWSWFLEEPLDKMSPPDWNWADFCGTQLLQVAIDHVHRLPPDLAQEVKDSILHAARSIKQRNVGPGYTNIALMGTYVTLVAGERFNEPDLVEYGKSRLRRFYDHTMKHGSFTEYNSPTYTVVAIKEISRMLRHVRDGASRELLEELNHFAWRHAAQHFHPPTRQWSGPHSRSYSTFLRSSTLAFIQRATGEAIRFMPAKEAAVSLDSHRLRCRCPGDLVHYFELLPETRFEKETFTRSEDPMPDIIGSTYLDSAFTLGSVNCGNLWNQRRPLIAYWGSADNVGAFRIQFLHDGYDYSSAMFFSVQDKGDVLAAVNFATDGGDTHPSLDPVRNATILAEDLRLRFLIEVRGDSPTLPQRLQIGEACTLYLGSARLDLCLVHAAFGEFKITTEAGRNNSSAWLDIVFYDGREREVSFHNLKEAVACFSLRLRPAAEEGHSPLKARLLTLQPHGESLGIIWKRDEAAELSLDVPTKPQPRRVLCSIAKAWIGDLKAWE